MTTTAVRRLSGSLSTTSYVVAGPEVGSANDGHSCALDSFVGSSGKGGARRSPWTSVSLLPPLLSKAPRGTRVRVQRLTSGTAPALHPMLRLLDRLDKSALTLTQVSALFDAAELGGTTVAELRVLGSVFERRSAQWSTEVRQEFAQRLHQARMSVHVVRGTRPRSAEAEDMSSAVRTMWMQYSGDGDWVQRTYLVDMARLAHQYHFKLVVQLAVDASPEELWSELVKRTGLGLDELQGCVTVAVAGQGFSPWGEDNKILTVPSPGRKFVNVVVPPSVSDTAMLAAQGFTDKEGYHPFASGFQGAVSSRGEQSDAKAVAQALGRKVIAAKTYLEGGNVLAGVTADGEAYALVGRDSLIISTMHLDEVGYFSDDAVVQAKVAELTSQKILTKEVLEQAKKSLERAQNRVERGQSSWGVSVSRVSAAHASTFLAKVELTKLAIAADLGVEPERVVYVTQPDFHIDMHLRPMRHGEVLINHPSAAVALLDKLLMRRDIPTWERRELLAMQTNARAQLLQQGPLFDQIERELEAAGLITLRAPGVFDSDTRLANFMNGVPGTTDDGTTFYFVNGSTITSLQGAVEDFFTNTVGVDQVEFVANTGGNQSQLSAGERSLALSGALDCREVHTNFSKSKRFFALEQQGGTGRRRVEDCDLHALGEGHGGRRARSVAAG